MSLFRFLFSKAFIINAVIILFLLLAIFWVVLRHLDNITLHGESISVPNLSGYTVSEVDTILSNKKLRFVISDSVYMQDTKKGVIVEQDPKPEDKVKENRTVYLVVNAIDVPKIPMPELKDLSLRQALVTLETYGFKSGELEYVPDFARDAVIGQKVNGVEVEVGELVKKGSEIVLIMGAGLSDDEVHIPQLLGLTSEEAYALLKSGSLNTGSVIYDETIVDFNDSLAAKIWRQHPDYGEEMIQLGGYVDVWLTTDESKIVIDTTIHDIEDNLEIE